MHVPQSPDSWTPSILSGRILILTSSQYPIDTQERLYYLSASVSREGHRIGQYNRWQQNKSIWVPLPYVAVRLIEALSCVGKWKPESALHCWATQVNPKGDCFSMPCRKSRQPDWVYLARNVLLDGLSGEVMGLGNKIGQPRPLLLLEVSEGRDSQTSMKSCDKADFFGYFLWLWEGSRAELRICEAQSPPVSEFL